MVPDHANNRLFTWHAFDLRSRLPQNWQADLLRIADRHAIDKDLVPTSVTSREQSGVTKIHVTTVGGALLAEATPWLDHLYRGLIRQLAESTYGVTVNCARDQRIGINLNVQQGNIQRYEAHVDSNPIEGLLYVTSHSKGDGGELVVSNSSSSVGVEEIDSDCSIVYPTEGHLVFFDARFSPHYVRPLTSKYAVRVVVAMNFYTDYSTEEDRPSDLNRHLFGD